MTTMPEPAPYKSTHQDGTPNLGSYEFQAAMGMVVLANNILIGRGIDPADAPGSAVKAIADLMMGIADNVQNRIRRDSVYPGRVHRAAQSAAQGNQDFTKEDAATIRAEVDQIDFVERGGNSHTRARGCVHTAVEAFPFPTGTLDAETLAEWAERVETRAYGLMRIAYSAAYGQTETDPAARIAAVIDVLSPTATENAEEAA